MPRSLPLPTKPYGFRTSCSAFGSQHLRTMSTSELPATCSDQSRPHLLQEPLKIHDLMLARRFDGVGVSDRARFSGRIPVVMGRFGPIPLHADASRPRARYRLASASSENTCAPFLAMPR